MNHLRRHFAKYNYFSVSLNFYSHNVCKSSVCVLGRGVLIYRDRSVNKIRYKELKELGWKRTNRIQHERFVMSEAFENDDNGDLKQMRELVYGKFSFRRIIKQQRFVTKLPEFPLTYVRILYLLIQANDFIMKLFLFQTEFFAFWLTPLF